MTIPVFVISLPDCHDRRARISAALDGLGLPFGFSDAVDGREGLPPEYQSLIDRAATRKKGRILTDAEFACALSHINVYRRIVADEIPYALVLEDDAVPQPDLVPYLAGRHYESAALTQLVQQDPIIYVRRSGAMSVFDSYRSYLRPPKIIITGTFGYVISFGAAKHFIDGALPVTSMADWPDCIETLIARRLCRIVSPPLVTHPKNGDSFIEHSRSQNKLRGKEKRRFLGVYISPFRAMANSYRRAPLKLFCKRLRRSEI